MRKDFIQLGWRFTLLFLLGLLTLSRSFGETQNSVTLTTQQIFAGQSGTFNASNTSGAAAVASGTYAYTYSGLAQYTMSSASGRYQGSSGNSYTGIQFGPFQFFRSFLTQNYFTIASAASVCPSTTNYNFLNIRLRTPTDPRGSMDASQSSFTAGGTITYNPSISPVFTLNTTFNLSGPTVNSSPNSTYDEWNTTPCSDGSMLVSETGANQTLDAFGTFFFSDSNFVYMSETGNPLVTLGVVQQTLSGTMMSNLSSDVYSGLYTKFTTPTTETRTGIYLYPNTAGTTYTLYSINDVNNPSNKTNYGTLTCTSLNSPSNGFCSGTLTVVGESGSGKAVCMVSTDTPEPSIACIAQDPANNSYGVTIVAHVPIKSVLAVSVPGPVTTSVNGTTTLTATLTNMTGRAISSIGDPSSGSLQLTAPFSDSGQYAGGGSACGSSLAGYASCTVTITYHPTAVGTTPETFRVAYTDGFYGTVNATTPIIGYAGLVSIAITPTTSSFPAGTTVQYTATATYTGGIHQDITTSVTWSDNNAAATISSSGLVTFTATGSTQISATLGSTSANQSVTETLTTIQDLGQSSPNGLDSGVAGLSGPRYSAVAGSQYFVSDYANNRLLIYNSLPNGNDQAADLVEGQPDSNTYTANSGGISASSLSGPLGVASNGTELAVADSANNRVLVWLTIPTTTQQPADLVLGQPDFVSSNANNGGLSSSSLSNPIGVAMSAAGVLYVADSSNNRILIWTTALSANQQAADLVLGQTGFGAGSANGGGSASASVMSAPYGIAWDGTNFLVADKGNNRVLLWTSAPTTTHQAANWAIGQSNLTTVTSGVSTTKINAPTDVASDGTNISIADNGNNRVLIINGIPAKNGATANVVLGQPSFTVKVVNNGGISGATLDSPTGVTTNGTDLYICDNLNNRVLIYTSIPTATHATANLELGQPNFTSNTVNNTGTPSSTNFFLPYSVSSDGTHMVVADTSNNRVLIWNTIPTSTDQAADLVLGQPNFTSNTVNYGGSVTSQTLSGPQGVYSDGTRLFVGDTGNNRVLIWNTFPTSNQQAASVVLGQSGFTTGTAGSVSSTSLSGPTGVYSTGTELFVADTGYNRVIFWTSMPTSNGTAANFAIGQKNLTSKAANKGGISAATASAPTMVHGDGTHLYVADSGNNRVLYFSAYPTKSNVAADWIIGQPNSTSSAVNNGGLSSSTLSTPTGVFVKGTNLFVADKLNNRVLAFTSPPTGNQPAALYSIGQPSFSVNTANNGGISAATLYSPTSVFSDGTRIWTADYNNDRILVTSYSPFLSFSSTGTYDYGFTQASTTATQTFTVTNYGMQTATSVAAGTPALGTPFTYTGGSYPGGGTCGSSLAGGASCTVNVNFAPTYAQTFSDAIRVSYSNGSATQTAAQLIQGEAISIAALTFTDGASYSYGTVAVGNSSSHAFTVSNTSGITATLLQDNTGSSIAAPFTYAGSSQSYPGLAGTCGTVIPTGTTCTVVVTFSPTSTGAASDALSLSYDNGSQMTTMNITVSGTGH